MDEYWKPVNLTRREYIHPHHVGCGLKLLEWHGYNSPVERIMKARWSPSDDVRALSDYGGEMQLSGSASAERSPDYETLAEDFTEVTEVCGEALDADDSTK